MLGYFKEKKEKKCQKKNFSSQNHDFFKSQTKIIEFKQSDKHQFAIDKLLKFKSFKKNLCLSEKFENIHTQKEMISQKKNLIHINKYIFYLNSVTSQSSLFFLFFF